MARVADPDPYPDPDWIRVQSGQWIRRVKMTHKSRKKIKSSCFEVFGWPLLRAEGFFCELRVSSVT